MLNLIIETKRPVDILPSSAGLSSWPFLELRSLATHHLKFTVAVWVRSFSEILMAAFLVQLHLKCGRPHLDLFAKALKSGSVLLLRRKDTTDTQMRSDVWPDHTLTCLLSGWSHPQTRFKSTLREATVMTEGNYNPATTLVWNHLANWDWLESQEPCKSVSFGPARTAQEIMVSSWTVQPLLHP